MESAAVRIDEPAKVDAAVVAAPDAAPQQVASLPEPEITGTVTADAPPQPIAPPLVNATPIRRPPVPRARPAAADVMAALPDPAIAAPAVNARQPVVRRRRAVVKPVVKPKPSNGQPSTRTATPGGAGAEPGLAVRRFTVRDVNQACPVATSGPSGNPHSAHEPSYNAVSFRPMRASASVMTAAVTPEPQVVTIGRFGSTPAALKTSRN